MNLRIFKFMETWIIIDNRYTRRSEIWIYKSTQKKLNLTIYFSLIYPIARKQISTAFKVLSIFTRARVILETGEY